MAGLVTASRIYPTCGTIFMRKSGKLDFRCHPRLGCGKDWMPGTRLVLGPTEGRTRVPGMAQNANREISIAVMIALERAVLRHANVLRLIIAQLGELHADLLEVQTRNFLVELLRQRIDLRLVRLRVGPQLDLGQCLVGER